jgi:glutamate synthase domain-containing protein 2
LSLLVDPEWGAERISNLYSSFQRRLKEILRNVGLRDVKDLRGRTDLLVYTAEDRGAERPAEAGR